MQAVKAIRDSYQLLSASDNLSPHNAEVTGSLTLLVRTLTANSTSQELTRYLLDTPDLAAERSNLPELCGRAECEMEKYWARKLLAQDKIDLRDFWYFDEYRALTRTEMRLFGRRDFDDISFLGAGALPLTAIMMAHRFPATQVKCVDFDPEACALAQALVKRLGLRNVSVHQMDALDYMPAQGELVICASLLQERGAIYRKLVDFPCTLMVRDAEGVYQFLYKAAELPESGFREVAKTKIHPKRINTTRLYEQVRKHAP